MPRKLPSKANMGSSLRSSHCTSRDKTHICTHSQTHTHMHNCNKVKNTNIKKKIISKIQDKSRKIMFPQLK